MRPMFAEAMAQVDNGAGSGTTRRLGGLLQGRSKLVRDYLTAVSGSAGRLVFSLAYFVALANALSLGDFGIFATASVAGVMISRLLGFGFISALYRTATIRPNLIGAYFGGFLMLSAVSLPIVAAAAWLVHALFFGSTLSPGTFAVIIAAEALLWRPVEAIIIVNNGCGRFGRAASMTILGIAIRAGAAGAFYVTGDHSLASWAWWYCGASALSLIAAALFFYPGQRLRLTPSLYWRRLPDSIYVAGAELLFYLQQEFDKLLVLAIGGPNLAGVYAIVMRLVDLTAIPIRTFNMMLVQKLMKTPTLIARWRVRLSLEAAIFLISALGMLVLAAILHIWPTLLGKNVATAAPLMMLALAIPGLRNLVEYQGELLFARGQTLYRTLILALLAILKGLFLYILLTRVSETADMILWLNLAFAALYLVSACLTYTGMIAPARRV